MQSVAIFIGDSQMAKMRLFRMFDFLGDCGSQLERDGVVHDVKSGGCFEQTVETLSDSESSGNKSGSFAVNHN